ncbi:MAG: hypothetical protein IPJ41_12645 [Phycisphaerales bacterium]|nr:hypothetical protein [Phycisphaerales bacterium]
MAVQARHAPRGERALLESGLAEPPHDRHPLDRRPQRAGACLPDPRDRLHRRRDRPLPPGDGRPEGRVLPRALVGVSGADRPGARSLRDRPAPPPRPTAGRPCRPRVWHLFLELQLPPQVAGRSGQPARRCAGSPGTLADDRQATDRRAGAGTGEPVARTLVPPGSLKDYEPPEGLPCISDCTTPAEREALIARARALLAEAGYPSPAEMPTIELEFNKDSGHDLIAQAIARDWQETLGVPVRLAQKELSVFRDDLKRHQFMTSRAGWYGDYPDPLTFLEISRTGDGNNDRAYSNPRFDQLLDDAYDEHDPSRRSEILREAERMLMEDDLPMVPIFRYVNVLMFDASRLSGPNPHPRSSQNVFLFDVLGDGVGSDRVLTMPITPRD